MAIPVRIFIGIMIFLTTYTNYTLRVSLSVSIVAMVKGESGHESVPECIRNKMTKEELEKLKNVTDAEKVLPDFGPRYGWDQQTQGNILGSYFYGYVVSNLIACWAAEWLGAWNIIFWTHLVGAFINSAIPFLLEWTPESVGYIIFMLCRAIVGFGAGLIYPAIHCLIAHWSPPAEKGKFMAGLMGNNLAMCISWPLVGAITEAGGWQWGFHFVTFQNLVFVVLFGIVVTDTPATHRFITEKEKAYILENIGDSVSKRWVWPPFCAMLKSFPFWILVICQFGNEWGLYLQLTGVPKFIAEVVGVDLTKSGGLAAIAPLSRMFFGIFFSSFSDFIFSKGFSNTCIRKCFTIISHVFSGMFLIIMACTISCNLVPIVILLTLSMSSNGAATVTNLRNPQDLAPNFAGTIYGIITFLGGMSGFIVPAITGWLIDDNNGVNEWAWSFGIGGAMYVTCGVVFIIFGTAKQEPWNEKPKETTE